MKIFKATQKDHSVIIELWETSVRATHHFLSEEDIQFYKPLILNQYLNTVELYCAKHADGKMCGFLGVAEGSIEMLFIHPSCRDKGIGKCLLNYAISELGAWKLDVNEQNPDACGFYEYMGFEVIGRSPQDGFGKPFPLLHMEYRGRSDKK